MYASLELSKELYEKTKWEEHSGRGYRCANPDHQSYNRKDCNAYCEDVPNYGLGYLLRKLPPVIQEDGKFLALAIHAQGDGTFHMAYCEPYDKEFRGSFITNADTPEDAAAALCINLIDQGILPVKEMK